MKGRWEMRAFVLTSGVVLAITGMVGTIQCLMLLAALTGKSPPVLWWEAIGAAIAFLIGGIVLCVRSGRLRPSRHWALSVLGVVLALVVVAVLKAAVQAMTIGI